jgi:hypothetical protein
MESIRVYRCTRTKETTYAREEKKIKKEIKGEEELE